MVGIIQYGAGNIRSVINALNRLEVRHFVSDNRQELLKAEKLIFPGVGEARSAMESLAGVGLREWLKEVTVPFLGICLGMQLLFERTTKHIQSVLALYPEPSNDLIVDNSRSKCRIWDGIRYTKTVLAPYFLALTRENIFTLSIPIMHLLLRRLSDQQIRCHFLIGNTEEELLWGPVSPGKIRYGGIENSEKFY